MLTTLCLMTCVWGAGQPGGRAEWQLAPRPARGQELVYRGSVLEESLGRGVQSTPKSYRLECRAFVLETKPNSAEFAFFTALKLQQAAEKPGGAGMSVRLEFGEIDAQGRLTAGDETAGVIPLDGPSTWETGFLIELPRAPVNLQQSWTVNEPGRPTRKFQVVGIEKIGETQCLKIVGRQQSDDWDKPRGDSTAWRRSDTLWIAPGAGIIHKVERDLERREPAHREPTWHVLTRYELDSSLRYENVFYEDRKREITQARQFQERVHALLPDAAKHGPKAFETLIARIDAHMEKYPPVAPYREALQRVRGLAEAGQRGETPVQAPAVANRQQLVVGKAAPEFVVEDLQKGDAVSSRNYRGKTLLMVFYLPSSTIAPTVLQNAQRLADLHGGQELTVVGLAMAEDKPDREKVAALVRENRLTYPTLAGKSLRLSYAVEATPRFVVVDEDGVVRGAYVGWGPEVEAGIRTDLKKCTSPKGEPSQIRKPGS